MGQLANDNSTPHYVGHRGRLKKRFLEAKKGSLPDYEILELMLFASHTRADVKPLAKNLIAHCGSLANVITAKPEKLREIKGVNDTVLVSLKLAQEAAERLIKIDIEKKPILQHWQALLDYCRMSMGYHSSEQFRVLYLDHKNKLITDDLQETGTVNQTPVYPREIIKRALTLDASALILVHNHPSGDLTPSDPDIAMTNRINHAAKAVGLALHDHVIVSHTGYYSFKESGLM